VRPLAKPDWSPEWGQLQAVDLVRDANGRFCSICERPLPQVAFAWQAEEGVLLEGSPCEADWPHLLVLCHNCAGATTIWLAAPVGRMALPHRELTFALGAPSPFSYEVVEPEEAERLSADADRGGPRVHVQANAPLAAQTVTAFALNTPVRGLHPDAPSEPVADQATVDFWDPRLELRTAAWRQAEAAATRLREVPPEAREEHLEQLKVLIEYTGFWSVWATVLGQQLEEPTLVRSVLSSEAGAFPGTRDEALWG
jgi:hypothetical protein